MDNRLAVITGASSGIGWQLALQLARRGHDVLLVARREERLRALADEVAVLGRKANVQTADLGSAPDRRELIATLERNASRLDLVLNNAGFGYVGPTSGLAFKRSSEMIDLNITAVTELTYAAVGILSHRRSGGIINVASTAAFQPVPYMNVYAATKAYVLNFTYALAEELSGSGIRVMALCPGYTRTEFHQVAGARLDDARMRYAMDPARCVSLALKDFDRGKRISVPGLLNKIQIYASWLFPRSLVAKSVARFMKRLPT